MLRALKKSFTCTSRQRKGSHSRQNSMLLHMAECAGADKDFDFKDNVAEDGKRSSKRHESHRSRGNSAVSVIGRNNSMNDWQDIVTALKNVDRTRHNSNEQELDVAENEPTRAVAVEEDQATSESRHQLSNNIASRLTPSATPLLHRKNSFDATKAENDSVGERFISEYNVRLEPVIKICIPCQHDHNQFHAQSPTARVTSKSGAEAIDPEVNSNSAAALMMRSINMAPARVEVAVETPEAEIAATVLSSETAAGDESFNCLALEPPPPTPEMVKTVAPSPTREKASNSSPQTIAGDRCADSNAVSPSSTGTNQAAAFVEVGEWTKGDSPAAEEKIDAKKEERKAVQEDEEDEDELMEPASASEVETSRQEARTLVVPDTAAHVDSLIQETEKKDAATVVECEVKELDRMNEKGETLKSEEEEKERQETMGKPDAKEEEEEREEKEEKEEKEEEEEEEEEQDAAVEIGSKPSEFEREGSPTSTSFASFVDVYDKEPLHPTDDSKTTMNLLRRPESQEGQHEPPAEHSNDSDVRVAPWLGANEPTTSADRWKRMKQIVKEREAAVIESPIFKAESESMSVEVDSRLQNLMNNLTCGVRKPTREEGLDSLEASINEELRHILSTLSSQASTQQRQETKSNSPQLTKQSRNSIKKTETKRIVTDNVVMSQRKDLPRRQASTGSLDQEKRRAFSIQMELDSSDAVVCSFLRPADRRVVAAAAKNNCTVTVTAVEDQPSKVMRKFLCVVRGPTRDQVARCINFLKDTFPKSYIRYNR